MVFVAGIVETIGNCQCKYVLNVFQHSFSGNELMVNKRNLEQILYKGDCLMIKYDGNCLNTENTQGAVYYGYKRNLVADIYTDDCAH